MIGDRVEVRIICTEVVADEVVRWAKGLSMAGSVSRVAANAYEARLRHRSDDASLTGELRDHALIVSYRSRRSPVTRSVLVLPQGQFVMFQSEGRHKEEVDGEQEQEGATTEADLDVRADSGTEGHEPC